MGIYFLKYLFIYLFIYLFESGRGGEREGGNYWCARETWIGCLLHAPRWGPGLQPRHAPWLGIEPATLWFTGRYSFYWATATRAWHLFIEPFQVLDVLHLHNDQVWQVLLLSHILFVHARWIHSRPRWQWSSAWQSGNPHTTGRRQTAEVECQAQTDKNSATWGCDGE